LPKKPVGKKVMFGLCALSIPGGLIDSIVSSFTSRITPKVAKRRKTTKMEWKIRPRKKSEEQSKKKAEDQL
jgi:hypothetical protein